MLARSCLLSLGLVTASATAQPATPAAPVPAPAAAAHTRARDDLRRVSEQLQQQAHAYTATCRAVLGHDDETAPTIAYTGAVRAGLALFRIADKTQVTRGDRQLQRTGEGAWTKPQGDMPDCPLSPHALARHLLDAAVADTKAVAFDDRPAQRVHVQWSGAAATALFEDVNSPDPMASKVVERLTDLHKKLGAERVVADATLVYVPATHTFYAATVRIALLDLEVRPAEAELLPAPEGLPHLQRDPVLQCTFTLRLQPGDHAAWPELDAAALQRLQPTR